MALALYLIIGAALLTAMGSVIVAMRTVRNLALHQSRLQTEDSKQGGTSATTVAKSEDNVVVSPVVQTNLGLNSFDQDALYDVLLAQLSQTRQMDASITEVARLLTPQLTEALMHEMSNSLEPREHLTITTDRTSIDEKG